MFKSNDKNKPTTDEMQEIKSEIRGEEVWHRRPSDAGNTLVSHAMREVVEENLPAGPHGALFTSPFAYSQVNVAPYGFGHSVHSIHSFTRHYLRRASIEGEEPVDFDDAIRETGHGKFQYTLMAMCGFIYACCSLSTTTLSFVLPAATHDFHLSPMDKGILNTAPLWGMVIGAYFWGSIADNMGRKFVLFFSLLTDAFAAFISCVLQSYMHFFICRIFNGFGIIGATSIVFAYLGEFLDLERRDEYLSRLELFWTFGIIALPVIGFCILPRDWHWGSEDAFHMNTWRIFVFACGIPSFIAVVWISQMPESPRFLLLKGRQEKTRKVLMRMFVSNTHRDPQQFPVKVLNVADDGQNYLADDLEGFSYCKKMKIIFSGLLKQHWDLIKGKIIFLTCFIDFGLMSVYYTIMLWVPSLLHHQEVFFATRPNVTSATLCQVSEEDHSAHEEEAGLIENSTFIHTLIVCIACLPSNLMLLFLIRVISKKNLLVGILSCAAIPTAAVAYMKSSFEVTTMLCLFEALTTLVETVLFCVIVEIFPLHSRGTALSVTVTIGRLGAVLGNIVFGMLIDNNCRKLFIGMSGMLVATGLSAVLLPKLSEEANSTK